MKLKVVVEIEISEPFTSEEVEELCYSLKHGLLEIHDCVGLMQHLPEIDKKIVNVTDVVLQPSAD